MNSARTRYLTYSFFFFFLIGIICYSPLYTTMLTNQYDGLWTYALYYAGPDREIPLGRWLLPLMDRVRYGYAGDPFNTFLAIAFFSIGTVLLSDLFTPPPQTVRK